MPLCILCWKKWPLIKFKVFLCSNGPFSYAVQLKWVKSSQPSVLVQWASCCWATWIKSLDNDWTVSSRQSFPSIPGALNETAIRNRPRSSCYTKLPCSLALQTDLVHIYVYLKNKRFFLSSLFFNTFWGSEEETKKWMMLPRLHIGAWLCENCREWSIVRQEIETLSNVTHCSRMFSLEGLHRGHFCRVFGVSIFWYYSAPKLWTKSFF